MNIFEYFSRIGGGILGLISGILIGITAVSLYLIYQYNIPIYGFILPVITSGIASFVLFLPKYTNIQGTISSFLSGILIVLTGFIIFFFFNEKILIPLIALEALASIILSAITFFSILFLFLSLGTKQEKIEKEEVKQRKIEKPPMDRL
ncbi:MAG: hypothetical protein RXP30_06300 [Thermoplasmata archaeon]|jgi:hypothetical protein|nr:hypothetical protein [Thermoplasmata archaeon]MVT13159.1 hypothetical protein [Euryarchaeota archaeon]MVT13925.1 hypothetical protein [Euryarchaeota archaeon]MVT35493.1 hypothetical protein [Euryarchaeota archaeon]